MEPSGRPHPPRFTDRNGNFLDHVRDAQSRVRTITDVHGRTLTLAYHAASGRVASVTDHAGRAVSFVYGATGLKDAETGPKGTTLYDYDASTRIVRLGVSWVSDSAKRGNCNSTSRPGEARRGDRTPSSWPACADASR